MIGLWLVAGYDSRGGIRKFSSPCRNKDEVELEKRRMMAEWLIPVCFYEVTDQDQAEVIVDLADLRFTFEVRSKSEASFGKPRFFKGAHLIIHHFKDPLASTVY